MITKPVVSTYSEIADKYTQQYFDDLSDTPWIDKLLSKAKKGSLILDVGSGPGQFTKYMIDKGYQVLGIDLTDEMLQIARRKVPEGDFRKMDMRQLDFKPGTFDGILAAYSLIHIPTQEIPRTLNEFFRVLKPKGYVLIIVQRGNSDQVVSEPLKEGEKIFMNFFTRQRIKNYLKEAGFAIIKIDEESLDDPDSLSNKVFYTLAQKK